MTVLRKWIIGAGASATAIIAITTLVKMAGLDPALSRDLKDHGEKYAMEVKRLDRKGAAVAIEVYNNKVRSFLLIPEPNNPVQQKIWVEELDRAKRQLKAAEERKIQLSK